MRVLLQRVSEASVAVEDRPISSIGKGLLLLLGIEEADDETDIAWLVPKIAQLRIFSDADGKMNLSLAEVQGEILVVSQFTLHASYKKGNRPSYIKSARPEKAIPLYETFISQIALHTGKTPATGIFGADMKVLLVNDGPVTLMLDSRNKE